MTYKSIFWKTYEGEMFIRSQTTTLLQIFCEFSLCSQVIFKSMKVADVRFWLSFKCEWVKENIQYKLNCAISVYCIHRLSQQPIWHCYEVCVPIMQFAQRNQHPASSNVNSVLWTENFYFIFFKFHMTNLFGEKKSIRP